MEGDERFASRMHSGASTSHKKPVGRVLVVERSVPRCVSSDYSRDRSSLEMFANYKRLAAEPLIPFVN